MQSIEKSPKVTLEDWLKKDVCTSLEETRVADLRTLMNGLAGRIAEAGGR